MSTFLLPDLGEGLHEAEIVAWLVAAGDHVVADQPMVSVETDKAVVEIPAPFSGRIGAIHGAPGDLLRVGDVLVEFADAADDGDAGAIVGDIARAPETTGEARPAPVPTRRSPAAGVRASPAVRARAARLDVDLTTITGTGPGGTITTADLAAPTAAATAGAEPLRGVRRAMATNMARAHREVVPATVTDDADVGDWAEGQDTTIRLARAVVAACSAEPALNRSFHGPAVGLSTNTAVDLGIAVDTDDGLFVPVLRDVGSRSVADLRRGLDHMKADVRARSIPPSELRGQTITLSNFGVFGGRHAALVVVPPQVAIVGAGRVQPAVVARDGAPAVRPLLPISLTFDHRVVMGGEAARFLTALIADLERPS